MFDEKCISEHALIYRNFREIHFMPNNNLKGIISHFICPHKIKIMSQKLAFP